MCQVVAELVNYYDFCIAILFIELKICYIFLNKKTPLIDHYLTLIIIFDLKIKQNYIKYLYDLITVFYSPKLG